MKAIKNAIETIINFFESIWDFITGIVDNTVMLLDYLGVVAELCYDTIASMPTWLQAFGTITILISVLYMILGRQGGKTE